MSIAHAIFAAGCFWGVQATFDSVPGVISTEVGYTGGDVHQPTYEEVCTGRTGHAEAIDISYDPEKVSYKELLHTFFNAHNPTTKNRQGLDIGEQYRSAVFYIDDEQKKEAEEMIKEMNASGRYPAPIVTEVVKAGRFYPAEAYHQKYLQRRGKTSCSNCNNTVLEEEEEEEQMPQSETEWKEKLSPEQYRVLREKGTERPFTGKYLNNKADGTYVCGACGNPIFTSDAKFDSGSGWPSFDKAIPGSVKLTTDNSHGMQRVEVTCAKCGSHLGHVFNDGPTSTGERFCINSVSMGFKNSGK